MKYTTLGIATLFVGTAWAGEAHWEYEGRHGPAHWGEMKTEYAACANGKQQSPINIKTGGTKKGTLPAIQFDYKDAPLKIVNNGHTIQVNVGEGSSISVDGKKYDLVQFHLHTPSEEQINGKHYAAVAHLVHKNAEGKLAVVAVLMQQGKRDNAALSTFWTRMPNEAGEARSYSAATFNPATMLPKQTGYYNFAGSLTTPPCSEGVNWFVLKTPVTLSAKQIAAFKKHYKHNARPVQALNDRTVQESI